MKFEMPYIQNSTKSLAQEARDAGAVLFYAAPKASGSNFATLIPRQLPNTVRNGLYTQKVSADYVLQASDISNINMSYSNLNYVTIPKPTNAIFYNSYAANLGSIDGLEVADVDACGGFDSPQLIGKVTLQATTNTMWYGVSKSTTLEQARALLAGTVIRYQLATPIDTLNPITQWVDYVGKMGKNLVDIFNVGNAFVTTTYASNKLRFAPNLASSLTTPYLKNREFSQNTRYTISGIWSQASTANARFRFNYTDGSQSTQFAIPPLSPTTESFSFTSGANKTIDYISISFSSGGNYTEVENLQLELGTTATAYEPYGKNNALLTNFASTQQSGYTLELTPNDNGQVVEYSNLVVNGDFANGTTGWVSPSGTQAVVGGVNEYTVVSASGYARIEKNVDDAVPGGRYYLTGEILPLFNKNTYLQYGGVNHTIPTLTPNVWNKVSGIVTAVDNQRLRFYHSTDTLYTVGQVIKRDNIQAIRLDNNPQIQALEAQLGRQLTVAECDRCFPFVATTGSNKMSPRVYLSTDGIDDYGIMANTPSVDIVGLEEFELAIGILTSTSIITTYSFYFDGNNGANLSDRKIQLYTLDGGSLNMVLEGFMYKLTSTGAIKPNSNYDIRVLRANGRLKCWINGVLVYDQPSAISLATKSFKRILARTNDASGTTHTGYFKGLTAYLIIARGTYGDLSKLDSTLDKLARDYRLGV